MENTESTQMELGLPGAQGVKLSRHDEMVLWLERRVREDADLLGGLLGEKEGWARPDVRTPDGMFGYGDYHQLAKQEVHRAGLALATDIPEKPQVEVADVVWEFPIRSYTGSRETGHIDLAVRVRRPRLSLVLQVEADRSYLSNSLERRNRPKEVQPTTMERLLRASLSKGEVVFRAEGRQLEIVGGAASLDPKHHEWIEASKQELASVLGERLASRGTLYTVCGWEWDVRWEESWVFFEVKTEREMCSIGKLLRQLKRYKARVGGPMVVVAASNDTAAGVLRSQGFWFLPYVGP